jgi:hypothetical protein
MPTGLLHDAVAMPLAIDKGKEDVKGGGRERKQ